MTDILHKLAAVSHLQAQDASSDLNKLADDQKEKVYQKREVRDLQEYYDQVMSDDSVSAQELSNLQTMRGELGFSSDFTWDTSGLSGSGSYATGDTTDGAQRGNLKVMESIEREIDGVMDGLEDDESLLQFEIQVGTSKMTSAEQSRAGAEKRLEDHRKTLQQKWEG
ncbi:MAG: hypothetical protein KC621_00825 [Myxococcales bacterium]|nr:hypothetical protein [Myxococcales bacterium]